MSESLVKDESVKGLLTHFLTKHKGLRDNDLKLLCTVWQEECGGREAVERMSALDLLRKIATDELSHPESVRRIRQLLQEKNPNLRGERYGKRQTVLSDLEKTGVHHFDNGSIFVTDNPQIRIPLTPNSVDK